MMAGAQITEAQFEALHRQVEEAKWLSHIVLQALIGKAKADDAYAYLQTWLDSDERRFERGTPVYKVHGLGTAIWRLLDADLLTLEDVASRPREEVRIQQSMACGPEPVDLVDGRSPVEPALV